MKYGERMKDPRYQHAMMLYSTDFWPRWKDKVPSDPHALENLRYALGMLAVAEPESEALLERVLRSYIGAKYHDAMREDMRRLSMAAWKAAA